MINIKKRNFTNIIQEIFQVCLIAYLVVLLIEQFDPGFISRWVDINIILGIVIIFGTLNIFLGEKLNKRQLEQ